MWICLNDAFLSIVAHRDKPGVLLVRARRPGDIERTFPGVTTHQDTHPVDGTPNLLPMRYPAQNGKLE